MKEKEILFKELRKLADRPESEFEFTNTDIEFYIDDCLKQESYRKLCNDKDSIPKVAKQIFSQMERNERVRRKKRGLAASEKLKQYELKGRQDDIRANRLVKEISPYVAKVRMDIFGNEETPFKTFEKAAEWIEQQVSLLTPDDKIKRSKLLEFHQEYEKQKKAGLVPEGLEMKNDTLSYIKDEWVHAVSTLTADLKKLKVAASNIKNFTGIAEAWATMHILTGIIPDYPRFEIHTKLQYSQLPTGQFVFRRYGEMKINVADITKEEITEAYNFFRERLNVKYKNSLSAKQMKLIEFIEMLGKVPQQQEDKRSGEIKGYWTDALNKWNREVEEKEGYRNWFSLQRAYNEALKKAKT